MGGAPVVNPLDRDKGVQVTRPQLKDEAIMGAGPALIIGLLTEIHLDLFKLNELGRGWNAAGSRVTWGSLRCYFYPFGRLKFIKKNEWGSCSYLVHLSPTAKLIRLQPNVIFKKNGKLIGFKDGASESIN
jgi:hypothetical protein